MEYHKHDMVIFHVLKHRDQLLKTLIVPYVYFPDPGDVAVMLKNEIFEHYAID